jgi:hypothetical protein
MNAVQMTPPRIATIGATTVLAGAVIRVLVPRLLPQFLQSPLLFSLLLRTEDLGRLLAFTGMVLSAVALVRAWRGGPRSTVLLSTVGLIIGLLVLLPIVLATVFGIVMGFGGGIPR